jgi:DNA-binding LacI/PurR family transcriptional regulator
MAVTLLDIAKKLNVSKMTVSRVLNNRSSDFITEATRKRVRETARLLGYTPNRVAQALVTGQTRRIAFLSPTMGAKFFQEVAYRFHQILQKDGYEIIHGEIGPQMMDSSHHAGLPSMGLDGVLMYGGCLGELNQVLGSFSPFKGPIVNMGPHTPEVFDAVNVDLYPASRQAVERLLDSGSKRVAHVLTPFTNNELDDRRRGYNHVLYERGKEPEHILVGDWSRAAARESIKAYVKEHGCPDGLFCANDDIAIGAYRGLRDIGIRIPDQARLIGCDGIEDTEYMDPPISTIVQPLEDMCVTAWKFLRNRLENSDIPRQTETHQARLAIRE